MTGAVIGMLKITYLSFDRMTDNEMNFVILILVLYALMCGHFGYHLYRKTIPIE